MGLPISILENILHNETVKPGMPAIIDDYNIELKTGEIVTIKELIDFWIEGHKAAEEVSKIVEENKRKSSEVGLQKDKGMERLQKENDRGEGTELPKLREENKDSSTSPRRQQRRKLSKPKS